LGRGYENYKNRTFKKVDRNNLSNFAKTTRVPHRSKIRFLKISLIIRGKGKTMNDLDKRIEELEKLKSFNLYLSLVSAFFILGLVTWGFFFKAKLLGGKIFVAYLCVNTLAWTIMAFKFNRKISRPKLFTQPEKLFELEIDRSISSNEISIIIIFIPILFGIICLPLLEYSSTQKLTYWAHLLILFFWVFGLYRWRINRNFLRREYKRIHGINYFSLF